MKVSETQDWGCNCWRAAVLQFWGSSSATTAPRKLQGGGRCEKFKTSFLGTKLKTHAGTKPMEGKFSRTVYRPLPMSCVPDAACARACASLRQTTVWRHNNRYVH